MSRLSVLLIVCATLSATTGLAHAGACADQSHSCGRQHSLITNQRRNAAELAQAEAQDALGYEPDCLLAARRAKQVLELP
jgi:hypothetical protein